MSSKFIVSLGLLIGSSIGGYIPTLLGFSFLSITSLVGSTLGAFIGIIIAYKLSEQLN